MTAPTHQTPALKDTASSSDVFGGFEPLSANYIYCPNQFFDVCLRNCSLSDVRLVAYVLRKTLGWLDKNGNPIEQNISVSWNELVEKAGISRGAIRPAIEKAVAAGFIICTQQGRAKAAGSTSQTGQYMLRWDMESKFITIAKAFQGFYTGEGHRTPIPNAFFDQVVREERLAVVKVVGTVLRHTVGYQNQFGGRRSDAPLPFSFIQKYANVRNRTTLSKAIQHALNVGFISRISEGVFAPDAKTRRPATYAVKWLGEAQSSSIGSENVPAALDRSKKRTSIGSETRPADRSKKCTSRKTVKNNTSKQQHNMPAVAAENSEAYELLRQLEFNGQRFDERTAIHLSQSRGFHEIRQQIEWLPMRNAERNPLGMLRKAIEEGWSEPIAMKKSHKEQSARQREKQQDEQRATEEAAAAEQKRQRRETYDVLLKQWRTLSITEQQQHHEVAIRQASSDFQRRRLRKYTNLDAPPFETLQVMAHGRPVGVAESS